MLARTKKHHTELRFIGPLANKQKAIDALKNLGFTDATGSVPVRKLFPEYEDAELPGVALRGARYREDMTQAQLSEASGIPQRHISMMENGKRPIGKGIAKKFAEVLNVNYKVFL